MEKHLRSGKRFLSFKTKKFEKTRFLPFWFKKVFNVRNNLAKNARTKRLSKCRRTLIRFIRHLSTKYTNELPILITRYIDTRHAAQRATCLSKQIPRSGIYFQILPECGSTSIFVLPLARDVVDGLYTVYTQFFYYFFL